MLPDFMDMFLENHIIKIICMHMDSIYYARSAIQSYYHIVPPPTIYDSLVISISDLAFPLFLRTLISVEDSHSAQNHLL